MGVNFIRTGLITVPGVAIPYPYGGKQRQIMVDLNTAALQSKGLSPSDVVNTITNQNLILPGGTAKIGTFEYQVDMNGAPTNVTELNNLPIKTVDDSTIYIHDVGFVRDGYPPQTNIVRVDGSRSVLMSVLKSGDASTLDIINGIKAEDSTDSEFAAGARGHSSGVGPVAVRARVDSRRDSRRGSSRRA